MAFNHVASGNILINGCAKYVKSNYVAIEFAEGSIVYNCRKATSHGVLEKIAIKKAHIITSRKNWNQPVILYEDTLNGYWNETELCSYAEATEFVNAYLEEQAIDASKLKGCLPE